MIFVAHNRNIQASELDPPKKLILRKEIILLAAPYYIMPAFVVASLTFFSSDLKVIFIFSSYNGPR